MANTPVSQTFLGAVAVAVVAGVIVWKITNHSPAPSLMAGVDALAVDDSAGSCEIPYDTEISVILDAELRSDSRTFLLPWSNPGGIGLGPRTTTKFREFEGVLGDNLRSSTGRVLARNGAVAHGEARTISSKESAERMELLLQGLKTMMKPNMAVETRAQLFIARGPNEAVVIPAETRLVFRLKRAANACPVQGQ
jgi:hypothetical protein